MHVLVTVLSFTLTPVQPNFKFIFFNISDGTSTQAATGMQLNNAVICFYIQLLGSVVSWAGMKDFFFDLRVSAAPALNSLRSFATVLLLGYKMYGSTLHCM